MVDIDEVFGQQVIPPAYHERENTQKVDAVKYERFVAGIFLRMVNQVLRMFGPVFIGKDMMADMIPIIPAFVVVFMVDTGDTVFIMIARIGGIYKGMLRPVAHHGDEPEDEKGEQKNHEGGREIDKTQYDGECPEG